MPSSDAALIERIIEIRQQYRVKLPDAVIAAIVGAVPPCPPNAGINTVEVDLGLHVRSTGQPRGDCPYGLVDGG